MGVPVRLRTEGSEARHPGDLSADLPRIAGYSENEKRVAILRLQPVDLSTSLAEWTGLEPATPGVTGRYSNQLNYHSASVQRLLLRAKGCGLVA